MIHNKECKFCGKKYKTSNRNSRNCPEHVSQQTKMNKLRKADAPKPRTCSVCKVEFLPSVNNQRRCDECKPEKRIPPWKKVGKNFIHRSGYEVSAGIMGDLMSGFVK